MSLCCEIGVPGASSLGFPSRGTLPRPSTPPQSRKFASKAHKDPVTAEVYTRLSVYMPLFTSAEGGIVFTGGCCLLVCWFVLSEG
ncbi:Hypothetical protein FKW44_021217 [Caligus rogercresseyi]|uniref:Uncharacterized protein n=1 Tax=Caligus rogercresseyi TaxID=217165 RepID=A0A7T8GRH3_CALRO|nr:Hypothetical protein FKW44_021217 [Caligus rogercresseyi]